MVLSPSQPVPAHVGAIITTEGESGSIDFDSEMMVIADGRPQATLDKAISLLSGEDFDSSFKDRNFSISVDHISVSLTKD